MEKNVLKLLGSNIKSRRLQLSLSRSELSSKSKLHINYISDVERGTRNISVLSLEKIAIALEISIHDLFIDSSY